MSSTISGNLHVANDVLADLVGNAAMECYGVVGVCAPNAADGIAKILPASRLRRGVVVNSLDEGVHVDLYIIVEYGTKEQIFDHPTHPYTIGLFGAIPDMNEDEEWLHPIDGLPPDPTDLPKGCAFSPRCKYAAEACRQGPIQMQTTPDGHLCRCCRLSEIGKERE